MIGPPQSNPYSAQITIIFLIFHLPSWWQHVLRCAVHVATVPCQTQTPGIIACSIHRKIHASLF